MNEELIKEALSMLKPNKCDALFDTMSDFYSRNGKPVYACAMDMSKAFDMVEWAERFLL